VNLDTGERAFSEQQFRNLGFSPDGPVPTREEIRERTHPDDRDLFEEFVAKLDAEKPELGIEYRIVLPTGEVRAIQAQGEIVTDPDGSRRLMGTSRDVTAERDAERLKDDFFGLVSHELRTPLTSIIGYTELLAEIEAENLSEQGRRFVEVIERNSRRELSLVGDLLLLTRITAGTFEIELGRADLGELVRATVEEAAPEAGKAGVTVSLEIDDAPVIDADPHRLGQVLANLVSNAIKFTPRGGQVAIRAAGEGEYAVLAVTDTGIGIQREDRDHLFERMYRTREVERRHIQGTGLGLTIVKAIVDAHGGSIAVDSDLGRGTTFRVELPLVAAPQRTNGGRAPEGRHE
jgi:signal transduction histidine kinase